MVIELSVGGLLTLLGIPTAITSLGLWLLQRRISKREAVQDAREAAREQNEVLLIQNAASLWSITSDPAEEWPEWSQPLGAHDAYAAGAKVSHNGKHWTSDLDGNVWEPGVYGWTEANE